MSSAVLLVVICCHCIIISDSFAGASSQVVLHDPTQCPTWFIPNKNGTGCMCGKPRRAPGAVKCYENSKKTTIGVEHCMTYDSLTQLTYVGGCPFYVLQDGDLSGVIEVPKNVTELNSFMCGGFNRTGVLCSHCEPGLGTPLLSHDVNCIECLGSARGWLLYIFMACAPSTALFACLLFFQFRATSAPMNCFILWTQAVSITTEVFKRYIFHNISLPLYVYGKLLGTFYGFWTLDFFRLLLPPFCINSGTLMLHALALEYVVAVYPLVLVVVVYVCVQKYARGSKVLTLLWVPFRVCFARVARVWDPSRSLVHVFASFIVLAYAKIMVVSVSLLAYIRMWSKLGLRFNTSNVVFSNASLPYFGVEHAPFGVLAVFMLVVFNVLPMMFLFLYPTRIFQSSLNCCKVRSHALHVFADAFNGCFKNGCGGTRDYRWFAGYYMFIRIALMLLCAIDTVNWKALYVILLLMVTLCVLLLLQPYKDNFFSFLDSSSFIGMTLIAIAGCIVAGKGVSIRGPAIIASAIPLFYFSFYFITKIALSTHLLDRFQCCTKLRGILQRRTSDFGPPPPHPSGQTPGHVVSCHHQTNAMRSGVHANPTTRYGAM